jgi:pimeloyl-ACP methyl ester carboxylesterase
MVVGDEHIERSGRFDQIERELVTLTSPTARRNGAGFHPCQGIYHRPATTRPTVAFIATHYNVDFSEHYLAPHLAGHGFGFLGWNTRYRGAESWFLLEHALIDIGVGVRWLREQAGIETIVLLGNSGGGSLMAAYQSQALEPSIRPAFGLKLPPAVLELEPADLYVSLQAHVGRPEVLTAWFDPAVTDETDPLSVDPALDLYDERNGPPFAPDFIERYRAAQVARNHRITAWARAELDRCQAVGTFDRNFAIHRVWADPRMVDPSIEPTDRAPNRCYGGDPKRANRSPYGMGTAATLRTWLSMWSLEASDCRGAPHLATITQPALVVQSTADTGVFPSDTEAIHEALGSADKAKVMIPGDHYLESPTAARTTTAALIADWVASRT